MSSLVFGTSVGRAVGEGEPGCELGDSSADSVVNVNELVAGVGDTGLGPEGVPVALYVVSETSSVSPVDLSSFFASSVVEPVDAVKR